VTTEYAGQNANFDQNSQAVPSWRWLASAGYDSDHFTATLTERFISAGKLNNAWVEGVDINNNHVSAVFYTDHARFQNAEFRQGRASLFRGPEPVRPEPARRPDLRRHGFPFDRHQRLSLT
jgi:hypothetical protein